MDKSLRSKIISIIEDEVDIDLSKIDPSKDIQDQLLLDSVQYITITSKIEEVLAIELPIAVMEVKTLNEFFDIIDKEFKEQQ